MNKTALALQNLTAGYPPSSRTAAHAVVKDISVNLLAGELVCLIGPNGAGKSTLMRTVSGMQKPLAGQVLLDGADIHGLSAKEVAKKLSIVLTERIGAGMMTAYELVALGRHPHTNWAGTLTERDHQIIRTSIAATGAAELAHRLVGELSDGERQKVMVARALAQEPQVLILDEITAFLDLPRRVEIMQILRDLAHRENRAVLLSTHDLDLALRSADKVWLLPKNGKLQSGAPEDLVLSGAFAEAFLSEGVEFDTRAGAFKVNSRHDACEIGVTGEEIPALWTMRALEREGFAPRRIVQNADGETHVQIIAADGQTLWKLNRAGQTSDYDSLAALVAALKRRDENLSSSVESSHPSEIS